MLRLSAGSSASAMFLARRGRCRRRRLPQQRLGRPAGLHGAQGLSAAGDDARPRRRRHAARPSMPASAGCSSRSRPSRRWCSRRSSRPRTRTSTTTAASTSPASSARCATTSWQRIEGDVGIQLVGASTITQQVAKNFLLSSEQTWDRKIQEAILALRIESTFSKDKILELYSTRSISARSAADPMASPRRRSTISTRRSTS